MANSYAFDIKQNQLPERGKDAGHKKEQPGNPGCGFKLNKVEAFSLSGKLIRI